MRMHLRDQKADVFRPRGPRAAAAAIVGTLAIALCACGDPQSIPQEEGVSAAAVEGAAEEVSAAAEEVSAAAEEVSAAAEEVSAAAEDASNWGDYAASLTVPACEGTVDLMVNTVGTELDGGSDLADPANAGDELSIVEALQIAANSAGRVAIHFDENVFSAGDPAIISLSDPACSLPALENVCIDARSRGVILDFHSPGGSIACRLDLKKDSLVVGLELRRMRWQVNVTGGSQLAGCRVNNDGQQMTTFREPEAIVTSGSAMVGPGNSIAGTYGVMPKGSARGDTDIVGNYFGLDPVTGAALWNQFGVSHTRFPFLSGALRITDNVFRGGTGVRMYGASPVVIENNVFERSSEEPPAPGYLGASSGVAAPFLLPDTLRIADNTFTNVASCIVVGLNEVDIEGNEFNDCGEDIVLP